MEFDKVIRKERLLEVLTIGYKTDDYLESPMHNVRKELEEMVRYM